MVSHPTREKAAQRECTRAHMNDACNNPRDVLVHGKRVIILGPTEVQCRLLCDSETVV